MPPLNFQAVRFPITESTAEPIINGRLYGNGAKGIILSNMVTNKQSDWDPLLEPLISAGYLVLTYDYLQPEKDQSDTMASAISFMKTRGAQKILLIGASRGAVCSLQAAAKAVDDKCLVGVVAISAPLRYERTVLFSLEELTSIKIPKLLINSELDHWAKDTRKMYEIVPEPKELLIYEGKAHGTEIFANHREELTEKLMSFLKQVFKS